MRPSRPGKRPRPHRGLAVNRAQEPDLPGASAPCVNRVSNGETLMKNVVAALTCGIGLLATPALAQTADQLAAMCDFLQTGMLHRDQNFGGLYSGAPDSGGNYALTRAYAWPYAGCAASKGNKWYLMCTWDIDGIKTAQQAQHARDAVGDQVPACIGTGYKRSTNAHGFLAFSLNGEERVDVAVESTKGKYDLSIVVFGVS